MKLLVTGANGQLGMSLRSEPSLSGSVFTDINEVPGVETLKLDITDLSAIRELVKAHGIDTVVNCAAFTNVDAAEDNYDLAELLNAKAVENLAIAMREVGGLLVHISTDYVFGGEKVDFIPCKEDKKGSPIGVYGLTKLHGEEAILSSGVRSVIIRTAWLYSEWGKNFVKTMLRVTAEKPSVQVVYDQVGTPTYARDLAAAIVRILEHPRPGIYHYSNEGAVSWYDFARMIASMAGHTSCEVRPCLSSEFPSKVHRPAYSVLDKGKIKANFGLSIPYWTESLKLCIERLKA